MRLIILEIQTLLTKHTPMKNYQQYLKQLREKQQLSTQTIASKMSFSVKTIEMLEDTGDLFSLNLPLPSLKSYLRKYAEQLKMPERKIIRMLNRIDYLNYQRARKGKLKPFDYFNRLAIVVLIALLGYLVYGLYQEQKQNAIRQSIDKLPSPVKNTHRKSTLASTPARKTQSASTMLGKPDNEKTSVIKPAASQKANDNPPSHT